MNEPAVDNWSSLLDRARNGNEESRRRILSRSSSFVAETIQINPKWRSALSVEDVMQVTYLEACLDLLEFNGTTEDQFRKWLARIAGNNLKDAIEMLEAGKRPQPENRLDDSVLFKIATGGTTPTGRMRKDEILAVMKDFVRNLPRDYRIVVEKRLLEQDELETVAEQMERSKGAVCMLQHHALRRLRELFREDGRFSTSDS